MRDETKKATPKQGQGKMKGTGSGSAGPSSERQATPQIRIPVQQTNHPSNENTDQHSQANPQESSSSSVDPEVTIIEERPVTKNAESKQGAAPGKPMKQEPIELENSADEDQELSIIKERPVSKNTASNEGAEPTNSIKQEPDMSEDFAEIRNEDEEVLLTEVHPLSKNAESHKDGGPNVKAEGSTARGRVSQKTPPTASRLGVQGTPKIAKASTPSKKKSKGRRDAAPEIEEIPMDWDADEVSEEEEAKYSQERFNAAVALEVEKARQELLRQANLSIGGGKPKPNSKPGNLADEDDEDENSDEDDDESDNSGEDDPYAGLLWKPQDGGSGSTNLVNGEALGFQNRGRGTFQVLVRYGSRKSYTYRLQSGANCDVDFDLSDLDNLGHTAKKHNRICERCKTTGYQKQYDIVKRNVFGIVAVAWEPEDESDPCQDLCPKMPGDNRRFGSCMVLLRVKHKDQIKETWEVRATVRRLYSNIKNKADMMIYECAQRQEHDYYSNNNVKRPRGFPVPAAPQTVSANSYKGGSKVNLKPGHVNPGKKFKVPEKYQQTKTPTMVAPLQRQPENPPNEEFIRRLKQDQQFREQILAMML